MSMARVHSELAMPRRCNCSDRLEGGASPTPQIHAEPAMPGSPVDGLCSSQKSFTCPAVKDAFRDLELVPRSLPDWESRWPGC